jgi:aryl-alcohol dehydrogenase-like predicted oxidoreductase
VTGPLWRDGPTVSPLGLGMAAIGRPAYLDVGHAEDLAGRTDVADLEAHAHHLLDLARDRGVTYVDAARSYGHAEAFLGSWLRTRELDPGVVTVGSKWGYAYVGGWRLDATTHEVKDHSLDALRAQWEESRRLLGRHLALYQIHSATFETGVLRDRGVLDELARLRSSEGVAIGVSVSGPQQRELIEAAMEAQYEGDFLFGTVQATWNLFEQSAAPALADAHHEGLGVIVKETMANGLLAGRDPALRDTPVWPLVEDADIAPHVMALAAALSRPWASTVLSGATTAAQLEQNLEALDLTWKPEWEPRLASMPASPADYWKRRAALPWT